MKKVYSIVLLGLLFPCLLFAQGETSNWLFGNGAGIRFNNDGSVSNITNSKLNTIEGCASISDSFGQLLFYTDGITVFNRNHETMLNGEGLFGDPSSTQSALIVPKPEDPELFYIFTVDTSAFADDPDHGLNYSVVDISQDNGLGAVTVKNTNLLQNCSEKITAVVKNCFEQSIWVVTLAAQNGLSGVLNTFYAYEVNSSGINSSPVKTTFPGLLIEDPRGYLKFSPDAINLAVANFTDGLSFYDFDVNTGSISNPVAVELPGTNTNAYGLEFSPNSQFLYVHATNNSENNGDHSSSLFQIDIRSADINASIFELDNRPIYRGALQQGENGKIYRTITNSYTEGTPYLGVIDKPNEAGAAADYEHNAIDLEGKISMQGLPPFIQSFFGNTALVRSDDGTTSSTLSLCSGEPLELEADSIPGAVYTWEKDGTPLTAIDTRTYTVPSASESDSGRYRVVITPADPNECPTIGESLIYVVPLPEPSIELTQCDIGPDDASDGISVVNLDVINQNPDLNFYFYESEADRDSDLPIADSANYQNTQSYSQILYYKVVNTLGCSNLGELNIIVTPSEVTPSTISPVYTCDDDPEDGKLESYFDLDEVADRYTDPLISVQFYHDISDAAQQHNPILNPELITESTTLYARLSDGNRCMGIETVDLIVNPSPVPTMAETYILCTDLGSIFIEGPDGFDSYRWYKKSGSGIVEMGNEKIISLSAMGIYELETSYIYNINGNDVECSNKTSFQLVPSSKAVINEIVIKDFSNNNILEISVQGEGNYEYSLDGTNFQSSPVFSNLSPGIYTSYVRDKQGCGISQEDVAVMGYPKFFTPNGDGVNDFWQLDGLSELFQANAFVGIYDRYGSFVTQIGVADRGWNGTANSRTMPADDYWFKVQLVDGREVQGHFTLKR